MTTEVDTRLRPDPACPPELRESLADFADEWPAPEQLGALLESVRAQLVLEAQLPRLRSPASGAPKQLRRALENDFEELPTAAEVAELHRKLAASLRFPSEAASRFPPRFQRRWLRALLVAALIALPVLAAAFVGYQLLVSRRAVRPTPAPSPAISSAPTSRPQPTTQLPAAPPASSAARVQVPPTPPPKPSSVPVKAQPKPARPCGSPQTTATSDDFGF